MEVITNKEVTVKPKFRLLNEKSASKRLGIHFNTLRKYRQGEKIKFVRIGKRILYRLSDLESFAESRLV